MATGELELFKAFEETTTRNLKIIQDYTKQSRTMVRELEESVQQLKNMVATRDKELLEMRIQLSLVQAKLFQGGTE